ncbi:MAG: methionine adenosyltransferase, partial [Candidatus Altarchaeaceae archaeon]
MNVVIEITNNKLVEEGKIEIVERKGLGHPDYIADSIAENFSRNLSKYYIENFGTILHHNVDKLEIVGGKVNVKFGGGNFEKPIIIFFSGRATSEIIEKGRKIKIPIKKIAKESAIEFIKNNYRFFNPEDKNQIRFVVETKGGSTDLVRLFK